MAPGMLPLYNTFSASRNKNGLARLVLMLLILIFVGLLYQIHALNTVNGDLETKHEKSSETSRMFKSELVRVKFNLQKQLSTAAKENADQVAKYASLQASLDHSTIRCNQNVTALKAKLSVCDADLSGCEVKSESDSQICTGELDVMMIQLDKSRREVGFLSANSSLLLKAYQDLQEEYHKIQTLVQSLEESQKSREAARFVNQASNQNGAFVQNGEFVNQRQPINNQLMQNQNQFENSQKFQNYQQQNINVPEVNQANFERKFNQQPDGKFPQNNMVYQNSDQVNPPNPKFPQNRGSQQNINYVAEINQAPVEQQFNQQPAGNVPQNYMANHISDQVQPNRPNLNFPIEHDLQDAIDRVDNMNSVNDLNVGKLMTQQPLRDIGIDSRKDQQAIVIAVPGEGEAPPVEQLPVQAEGGAIAAPRDDDSVERNPAEEDAVANDGQGAMLPPMNQQEKDNLEQRMNPILNESPVQQAPPAKESHDNYADRNSEQDIQPQEEFNPADVNPPREFRLARDDIPDFESNDDLVDRAQPDFET
jgi:hypothetical protein